MQPNQGGRAKIRSQLFRDLAAADTALELEAALHVGECSRIKEGTQRSGRSFSETADDVVEAEAVEAQAGQELVADKPVSASLLLVFLSPVPADAYDLESRRDFFSSSDRQFRRTLTTLSVS